MRASRILLVAWITLAPASAAALGEVITDIRIVDNQRTSEDTIRSIAGVSIGDILGAGTLEKVRERLNNAGLFSDVNVYWEPFQSGVRINIIVKDKFPWAPVPTFSLSKGNTSFGLLFVHGNLFGRGKQLVAGGRLSSLDSGAILAYRDPALFGTWFYWQLRGKFQDQVIPEFNPHDAGADQPLRESDVRSWGGEVLGGIAWLRKVKTQFGFHLDEYRIRGFRFPIGQDPEGEGGQNTLPYTPPATDARAGFMLANLIFDFRAREYSVLTGNALDLGIEYGSRTWGGQYQYWKAMVGYEHFLKFGRRVNLRVAAGAFFGHNLPLWAENWSGGDNLRGYLARQFRGDSQLRGSTELHFPLMPLMRTLEIRGVLFYDAAAVWYRDLPEIAEQPDPVTGRRVYQTRPGFDTRNFLPPDYLDEGFVLGRNFHNAVGGGVRFFLRSVSVPLVGIDYGYGLESRKFRLFIVVGA